MSIAYYIVSDTPLLPEENVAWSLWFPHTIIELQTRKAYGACLEWDKLDIPSATALLEYLKNHLQKAKEAELWHLLLDGDLDHKTKSVTFPLSMLTPQSLKAWLEEDVCQEPITDRCLIITQ